MFKDVKYSRVTHEEYDKMLPLLKKSCKYISHIDKCTSRKTTLHRLDSDHRFIFYDVNYMCIENNRLFFCADEVYFNINNRIPFMSLLSYKQRSMKIKKILYESVR